MGLIQCRSRKWNGSPGEQRLREQALIKENSGQLRNANTCLLTQFQECISGREIIPRYMLIRCKGRNPDRLEGCRLPHPKSSESCPLSSQHPLSSHPILCHHPPPLPCKGVGRGEAKGKRFLVVEVYSLFWEISLHLSQTFQPNFQGILQTENPPCAPWCLHLLHHQWAQQVESSRGV